MASLKVGRWKRGLAAVEMALLLPLLILFLFGILEYGWMFTKAHQITNAARHGARLAILPDTNWAQVQTAVATLMTNAGMAGKYTLSAAPGTELSAISPGSMVAVTLTVKYEDIKLTGIPLIPTPSTLGASVTMAREGP